MTITQLRYFLVLTEEMNFTHAAKQLFISQSTLSQHISKLEAELGTALFHRGSSRLTLTPEGKYIKTTVESLLLELDSLPQALAKIRSISQENIVPKKFSIGIDSATFTMDLPMTSKIVSVIQTLSEEYPGTEIVTTEISNDIMFQQLFDKKLDVTVGGFHYPKGTRLSSRLLSSQQMNLVTKMQPQWEHTAPTLDQAQEIISKFDVYAINFDEQYTLKIQQWLEQMGYRRTLKFSSSNWIHLLQLQLGRIAAIVPSNRLDPGFDRKDFFIYPIEEISIPRYISWHSDNNHPMLQKFIDRML